MSCEHANQRPQAHRELLRKYKIRLTASESRKSEDDHGVQTAYDDLASTHEGLEPVGFDDLVEAIGF